jgi:hypothetical protein
LARSGDGVAVLDCGPVTAPGPECWSTPFVLDEHPVLKTTHPAVNTMTANRPTWAITGTALTTDVRDGR